MATPFFNYSIFPVSKHKRELHKNRTARPLTPSHLTGRHPRIHPILNPKNLPPRPLKHTQLQRLANHNGQPSPSRPSHRTIIRASSRAIVDCSLRVSVAAAGDDDDAAVVAGEISRVTAARDLGQSTDDDDERERENPAQGQCFRCRRWYR